MLNEYFTRMVEIVFRHQGTLDKFVGDMVMALFGAPLDDPEHADHAVEAALEMIDELARAQRAVEGRGPARELDIGIGINTGPMIAGNIGSEAIMSYTVIGDAVNLGSRLESLNKEYGTRIIISDATRDAARAAATASARSATSSSRARRSRWRSSRSSGRGARVPAAADEQMRHRHEERVDARRRRCLRVSRRRRYAQLGGARRALKQGAAGAGRQGEARRPQHHRGGRAEDRRGRQREDPRSASASCRIAAVHKYVTLVGTDARAAVRAARSWRGRSSCSTPTASTRSRRRAASCTSRAARSG